MITMKIKFWSDYACPYCYIGEMRLFKAVKELGFENKVIYEPCAFELDPTAKSEVQSDTASRFSAKYMIPLDKAKKQIEHISNLGRAEGIDFKYATSLYTNTFNAHRLMKLALSTNNKEIAWKTNELLFDAYFTKNLKLADTSTLVNIGKEAGMNEIDINKMLESDLFKKEVREDEKEAQNLGVHGVPYFVFENGITIPGALSVDDFKKALQSAASSLVNNHDSMGGQCGPNGCILK